MTVTGCDFVMLQVRDLDAATGFYENALGLRRAPIERPDAVVYATTPIPMGVRTALPGTDLDEGARPGNGLALWLRTADARALHAELVAAGVEVAEPAPGPFGWQFTVADPDGYLLTVHDGT
ncbi:VOC family protein [Pseudonocardia nigra]|uniref:VOC family protein n=1 Tax=Pseudonocardia nigra TaxID=1921578 RepID=UPI001C602CA0|nr:VOC family protein [Pseudonocardia nigra]